MALRIVKLGFVGPGHAAFDACVETLSRQSRLMLTDVFDPCLTIARERAARLRLRHSPSLMGLLGRTQGVIVGDVKWMGIGPLIRAAECERATLVLTPVLAQFGEAELTRLQQVATRTGAWIMPGLSYRWARSALRLRELTATRLGAIESLNAACQVSSGIVERLLAVDWCRNVVQSEVRAVETRESGEMLLRFRRLAGDGAPVTARLALLSVEDPPPFAVVSAEVDCRQGQVRVLGEQSLEWSIGPRLEHESLVSDRAAADVMYDLFGRRLVGGIVPVPDLADLIRAQRILAAAEVSRLERRAVSLDEV